ncbi:MAG: HlyD family efflux transporter periplasmic adaptor subunit, partial [Pseudomonadota bacterium]
MPLSRLLTFGLLGLLVALFFLYAFWPQTHRVDYADVTQGPMMVTIDEEAKARVKEVYVVSTPAAGRLMRVEVDPGDEVVAGETTIARMMPTNPNALDIRTEEQALASVSAAEAALELAQADANRAEANLALAQATRSRFVRLVAEDTASQAALDEANRNLRATQAETQVAAAAIRMREADLQQANALLMDITMVDEEPIGQGSYTPQSVPIMAPIPGVVLRLEHESETTLPAGAGILHIGDPGSDLEIVAEMLSSDAVQVSPGDRVIIDRWGGDTPLAGEIKTVEPWAFTKVSALGIEEQRVNVIIQLMGENSQYTRLGHGYRVYARIVTWEKEDALMVPSNAVFPSADG